jgi:UDP-2,3-diacylglucosamine hydrolase
MKTLFISDIHLSASNPELSSLFFDFLEKYHPLHHPEASIDALYILGDLFEVWMGDDTSDPYDKKVMQSLREYSDKGIPVYFMQGNRDFLIGQGFADQTQCTLLQDPTCIELYGKRLLLMHGDLLCTLDRQYQWFRKIARSTLIRRLFLSLTFSWRRSLVDKIRRFSTSKQKKPKDTAVYDAVPKAIQAQLRSHQTHILIHGHTHKPGIHTFSLDGQAAKRIVLGDWGKKGSVLTVDANSMNLETFESV